MKYTNLGGDMRNIIKLSALIVFLLILTIASAEAGSISGTVYNNSSKTGSLIIMVFDYDIRQGGGGEPFVNTLETNPTFPYEFNISDSKLKDGVNYYIAVLLDINGNNRPDYKDLFIIYGDVVQLSSGTASGINITFENMEGTATISGKINYTGSVSYDEIFIALYKDFYEFMPAYYTTITSSGEYSITGVKAGEYYVRAFIDNNLDFQVEDQGWYLGGETFPVKLNVSEGASIQNIDINFGAPAISATVNGTIYNGTDATGKLFIAIFEHSIMGSPAGDPIAETEVENPTFPYNYSLSSDNFKEGVGYFVAAAIDKNSNGKPDYGDVYGQIETPFFVSGNSISGINLTISLPFPTPGSLITGTIYNKTQAQGDLLVALFDEDISQGIKVDPIDEIFIENPTFPVSYSFTTEGLKDGVNYYVSGFIDVNGNYEPDNEDVYGLFNGPVVLKGGKATGIDFAISGNMPGSELGTVSGIIRYSGSYSDNINIGLFEHLNDTVPVAKVKISAPGTYIITNVEKGEYFAKAYIDTDEDDKYEAVGSAMTNEGYPKVVFVGSGDNIKGVDILVRDVTAFIYGNVSYSGKYTGKPIIIAAFDLSTQKPASFTEMSTAGPFRIPIFKSGYYGVFGIIIDRKPGDPLALGVYGASMQEPTIITVLTSDITDIDFTIEDISAPVQPGSAYISGTVSYSGSLTYDKIIISAFPLQSPRNPKYTTTISEPGAYKIENVNDGKYIIRAFFDSDGDWKWDATGIYFDTEGNPNIVTITGGTPIENVNITLADNNPPEIVDLQTEHTITSGELFRYEIDAYDPDGDSILYAIESGPDGLGIAPRKGIIYWNPMDFQVGTHTVKGKVSDWYMKDTKFTLTISVVQGTDTESPIIVYGPTIVEADTNYVVAAWATNELTTGSVTYAETSLWQDTTKRTTLINDSLKKKHIMTIPNLKPDTKYTCYITAVDSAENTPTKSHLLLFKTKLVQDLEPPVFIGFPQITNIDTSSFTLIWDMNEPHRATIEVASENLWSDEENRTKYTITELALKHRQRITGLTPNTKYKFRILAKDAFGNGPVISRVFDVKTSISADNTQPVIIDIPVAINITMTQAEIIWKTNEASTSIVQYAVDSLFNLGQYYISKDEETVSEHRVILDNLSPSTRYIYRVGSVDAAGNGPVYSIIGKFKTKAAEDTKPPVIIGVPIADNIDTCRAEIKWQTNEAANSTVEYAKKSDWPNNKLEITYNEYVINHIVTLSNVISGEEYIFRTASTDKNGNGPTYSGSHKFKVKEQADTKPPVIIGIPKAEVVDTTTISVKWLTNEPATSTVFYATENTWESNKSEVSSQELTRTHLIYLSNLTPGESYKFKTSSYDKEYNGPTYSNEYGIKLPQRADTSPPVIIGSPVELGIDTSSVTIAWKTDEPANSVVEIGKTSTWPDNKENYSVSDITREHKVYVSNLEPKVEYTYRISSTDTKGNGPTYSGEKTFETKTTEDTNPPVIVFGPGIFDVGANRAMIKWAVNEISTGYIEYGKTENYGNISTYSENKTGHKIVLTDLDANTEYNFKIYITDLAGNSSESQNSSFKTKEVIVDTVQPEIIAGPISADIKHNRAVIKWKTNINTTSIVRYGLTTEYDYEIAADESYNVQNHIISLTNLESDTVYHCQVASVSGENLEVESTDFTFRTKAEPDTMPPIIIEGPIVAKKEQEKAVIVWKTDKLSDSYVEFGLNETFDNFVHTNTNEGVKHHRVVLTGLTSDTEYDFKVKSTALNGKYTITDVFSFRTKAILDTIPPKITAGPTAAEIQYDKVTILWKTDEPSDSYILFGKDKDNLSEQWSEDDISGVQEHKIILTGLKENTRYVYRVVSRDLSQRRNKVRSVFRHFKTATAPDTLKPVIIEGPIVTSLDNSARFYWVTDELADSYIYYRAENSDDNYEFVGDETKVKEHEITVTNLTAGAEYEFVIVSSDFENNTLTWPEATIENTPGGVKLYKAMQPPGGDGTFVTNENPDTQLPIIVSGPTIVAKTSNSVTIEWETDENSDSYVEYFLGDSLIETAGSAEYVTNHNIVLTNLAKGTTYKFLSKSSDVSRNGPIISPESYFETLPEEDNDPPVITKEPTVTGKSNDRATIHWKTDEMSDSKIEYSTDSLNLDLVKSEMKMKISHNVTITNLESNTKYYYRIASTDGSNNGPSWSDIKTFTTNSAPDITAPQISNIEAKNVKNNKATIKWETDELSDSFIEYGTDVTLGNKIGVTEQVTSHELKITNLNSNTKYYFVVGSVDLSGNTAETIEMYDFVTAATEDSEAPASPSGFDISAGEESAFLNWNSNNEEDLAGYNIFRKESGEYTKIASGVTDTFYYDYGLTNGTTYSYKITAYDDILPDYNESDYTTEIQTIPSSDHHISAPVPAYPADNVYTSYNFTFRANPSTEYSQERPDLTYQIAVSQDSTFYNMVVFETGIEPENSTVLYPLKVNLEHNQKYWWKLKAFDGLFSSDWSTVQTFTVDTTIAVGIEEEKELPTTFKLYHNYPNPFNPYTTIRFDIPKFSNVSLKIYNILGQEVKTLVSGKLAPGEYKILWDGRNDYGIRVSSGMYFYRIIAGKFIQTKKMVLLK